MARTVKGYKTEYSDLLEELLGFLQAGRYSRPKAEKQLIGRRTHRDVLMPLGKALRLKLQPAETFRAESEVLENGKWVVRNREFARVAYWEEPVYEERLYFPFPQLVSGLSER